MGERIYRTFGASRFGYGVKNIDSDIIVLRGNHMIDDNRIKEVLCMKPIKHNQLYRNRLLELQNQLEQARCMIPNHKPSLGFMAEAILRNFLKSVLPQKVTVGQGFVECGGELSYQCDIILYDAINYAPLYSYGEIVIVPHDSVFAVIEVKTSIDSKRFGDTLFAFQRLEQMEVRNKFLFLYNGCKINTMRQYFFGKYVPAHEHGYDFDNYDWLPEAIVSLNKDYYLAKGQVETVDGHCMNGYMAFKTYDNDDISIACLQEFVFKLMDIVSPPVENYMIPSLFNTTSEDSPNALKTILVNDGFGLFD